MIGGLIQAGMKFIIGKVSGPILVYVVLALFAANVTQGYLLKSAWNANARAQLECENQALRDAVAAREAVEAEKRQIEQDLRASERNRRLAGAVAMVEIERRLAVREAEHAEVIRNMEFAQNEITDEEYFCASEPVSAPSLDGMRDAATRYNETRDNPSAGANTDRDPERPIDTLRPD